MSVIEEVLAERTRQILSEGYTAAHDDEHGNGELARLAALYAVKHSRSTYERAERLDRIANDLAGTGIAGWFKPKGSRRDLIRAAALLVAEIERLDRAAATKAA